jgi:hypothetical protein
MSLTVQSPLTRSGYFLGDNPLSVVEWRKNNCQHAHARRGAACELRNKLPEVPFVGMEPAVKPAEQTKTGIVGVLATPATFQGHCTRPSWSDCKWSDRPAAYLSGTGGAN